MRAAAAARRLLAMFGAEAKVKAPQCSSARGALARAFLALLSFWGTTQKEYSMSCHF